MFKNEEIEARLKELKDNYDAEVAKLKESEALLLEKDKAVKELAAAKEALKEAQKKHDDIVAQIDKALGKPKRVKDSSETGAPRGKRGAKGEKILAALAEVYPEGYTVAELETKTGEKNLGVWFATTGSKVAGLTRPKRGFYVYQAPAEVTPAA